MSEPTEWKKHLIFDVRKKDEVSTSPKPDTSPVEPFVFTEKLSKKIIETLLSECNKIKKAALSARNANNTADGLKLLEQAEDVLAQAERIQQGTIGEKEIKEIIEKYVIDISEPPAPPVPDITPIPESIELAPLLKEQLTYWSTFYRENNYHWITIPDSITLSPDQLTQMQELMSQGFTKMIIIPENLVENPKVTGKGKSRTISNPGYERLHQTATQGYNPTFTGSDYDEDGKFQGSKDKTTSLRIILTKDVQNIDDDVLFQATKRLSIEQLEKDPKFSHLLHLTESAYLVYQQEYFKRTGKHLDKNGWTWLPGSERPLSDRVPYAGWGSGDGRLFFHSFPRGLRDSGLGCRLAGGFEVKV